MSVLAPAEVLSAARREGDSQRGVGQPLHEKEDESGRGSAACDYLGEVNAVVEAQVGIQALAVVVDQAAEAEASPT